jgi:glucose-6-phosphate isomerase
MREAGFEASLGSYAAAVDDAIRQAEEANVLKRIWSRDASLWKTEDAHQRVIKNALGWLTVAREMREVTSELIAFADEIRGPLGFQHVMVCGMGGSSLCPEVLRQTFGKQPGYPELLVLDSTDPDVLADFGRRIDITKCLFIISSKSGTTTEPLAFQKYWYAEVAGKKSNPGSSFIAITDPGTPLVKMAEDDGFLRVFLNQPDIGGRYSALSYFGMVPATLAGIDPNAFLDLALNVVESCGPDVSTRDNPAVRLGVIMAECALRGRDKLTLIADKRVGAIGLWIEQLIAESTGKEGKGIVPVNGEPLGAPAVYGNDRLFVSIGLRDVEAQTATLLQDLAAAGHPVVYLTLEEILDLGGYFFLWELATAVAGWRLGINPFDQPNVQESKDATRELLESFARMGQLFEQNKIVEDEDIAIYSEQSDLESTDILSVMRTQLGSAKPGDYFALLDYFEETTEIDAAVQQIRTDLRDSTRCATTTGYGPRFLHSTGQLHKGGPDTGIFIQITANDRVDFPIPGEPYTFTILKQAQALGDFRSLSRHGRRAIRVHLFKDVASGLRRLRDVIKAAQKR